MAQQEELTVESMLNDPRYQSLAKSNPALAEQLLSNYKRALQGDFSFEAAAQPEQAPEPSPAPSDQAFAGIAPPENAPQEPGMLSNLASALMQSGGFLSPTASGAIGGGMIAAEMAAPFAPAAGPFAPLVPLTAGLLGAGVGAMGGKGYEWLTGMSQPQQPGLGGAVSELGQTATGGMTAQLEGEAGGQLLKGGSQLLKTGLKYAAGQTNPATLAARIANREATAAKGLEPGLASEVTGNPQLSYLESLPARFVFGVKQVFKFLDRREASNRAALVKLADERAPGASTDWKEIGDILDNKATMNENAAVHLAGSMYDKGKQLVGPGTFAGDNVVAAATNLVKPGGSKGLNPDSIESILADAGYRGPGESYSFSELIKMQQDLGNALRRFTKPSQRAQRADILSLWSAVGNDMTAAAETAGQPAAIELINQGKRLYTDKIIPVFRDPDVLRTLAKDPYNTARTLMGPSATPDLLLNIRRAVGTDAWNQLTKAWQKSVLDRATKPTGSFDPKSFLAVMKPYTRGGERTLRTLLGRQYEPFMGLMDEFTKQAAKGGVGGISPEQLRGVLAQGQLIQVGKLALGGAMAIGATTGIGAFAGHPGAGALTGLSGTAIAASMPEALGRLLFSDKGIKWLTVGMKAQPGSFTASRALLKLTALAAGQGEFATGRALNMVTGGGED